MKVFSLVDWPGNYIVGVYTSLDSATKAMKKYLLSEYCDELEYRFDKMKLEKAVELCCNQKYFLDTVSIEINYVED